MIPYGKQSISNDDVESVIDVLKSDFLTQGPVVPQFELEISKYVGATYAVAVNSATSALHIACLSLGVNKNSVVWISAISFVASSNCALYCGATVDFVDIDKDTINISPETLVKKIKYNYENNLPLPDVLIVVHMAGQSCDMKPIHDLAQEYKFKIIEDASHAIGASYYGKPVGSCIYSDITVFSFHPVKIITTGEGGIAVTNDENIYTKMNLYRSHGVTRDERLMSGCDGPWYYEQIELGFNYRMTEMQAALGLSQVKSLNKFVSQRNKIAIKYDAQLHSTKITLPVTQQYSKPSWHLYVIQLNADKLNREDVFTKLREKDVGVNVHYRPIYLNPYYQSLGFKKGLCPNSEEYYSSCISIPLYHGMPEKEQDAVIYAVNEACA